MDSLNTILNSGTYGENVSRHNDNNSKIKQAITTLENVAIANKGYFDTLASLQAAFPSPKAGNIAYVANAASSTGYYIYNVVSGMWTATSTEAPAVDVAISNYAQHGYSSSPKTLKQVDDEVVKLAGDVVLQQSLEIKFDFEIGAINPVSGLEYDDVARIRTQRMYFDTTRTGVKYYNFYTPVSSSIAAMIACSGDAVVKRIYPNEENNTFDYDGTYDNIRVTLKRVDGLEYTGVDINSCYFTLNTANYMINKNRTDINEIISANASSTNTTLDEIMPEIYFKSGFDTEQKYYVRTLALYPDKISIAINRAPENTRVITADININGTPIQINELTYTYAGYTHECIVMLNVLKLEELGSIDNTERKGYSINNRAFDLKNNKVISSYIVGSKATQSSETLIMLGDGAGVSFDEDAITYMVLTDNDVNAIFDQYKENVDTVYTAIIYGHITIVGGGINKYPNFNLIGRGCTIKMGDHLGANYKTAIFPTALLKVPKMVNHNNTVIDGFNIDGNMENQMVSGSYVYYTLYGSAITTSKFNDDPAYTDTQLMTNIIVRNCNFKNFIRNAIVVGRNWVVENVVVENSATDHGLYLVGGNNILCNNVRFKGYFEGGALTIGGANANYQEDIPENIVLSNLSFIDVTGDQMIFVRGKIPNSLYPTRDILIRNLYIKNTASTFTSGAGGMICVGHPSTDGLNNINITIENLIVKAKISGALFNIQNTSFFRVNMFDIDVEKTYNTRPLIMLNTENSGLRKPIDFQNGRIKIHSSHVGSEDVIRIRVPELASNTEIDGFILNNVDIEHSGSGGGVILVAKINGLVDGEDAQFTIYNASVDRTTSNIPMLATGNQIIFKERNIVNIPYSPN